MNFYILIQEVGDFSKQLGSDITEWFHRNLNNIILALVILVLGWFLIKLVVAAVRRYLIVAKVDESAYPIILSTTRFLLRLFLFAIVATKLGFDGKSIFTMLGALGLGAGFALKDSLSNFASGILIFTIKPFIKDDIVESQGVVGKVKKIHIFNTEIITFENKSIVIPNSSIMNNQITNTTKMGILRLDIPITIDYKSDLKLAKELALEIITNHENTIKDRALAVFVSNLGDSSIELTVRCFVSFDVVVTTRAAIWESLMAGYAENNIHHPYPSLSMVHGEPK